MLPATTHTARPFAARVRSDLGRLIALVLCAVVLLAPLHSAFEGGGRASPSVASFESSELPGGSQEPDGPARQHGAPCPCGVAAAGFDAGLSWPPLQAAVRVSSGPSGNQLTAPPPTPPPPRT